MRAIYVVFILLIVESCFGDLSQAQVVSDPVEWSVENYRDENIDSIPDIDRHILVKIIRDFNNDGIDDIAISDTYDWGNAGGGWDIFLGSKGKQYTYLGDLFFHPDAIAFAPVKYGVSRIITYSHLSAGEGNLDEYRLSAKGMKKTHSKLLSPDSYKKNKDYQEYEKLFGYLYQEPISVWCRLADYLREKNCEWHPGYHPKHQ